ncbi:hypothetical protein [Flavobacterium oreochromis]|uniref:DUF3575 domain-containing protein n=1 Tax=Flavobacterium columnare TaxID=996 RepID=A0A246G8E6_9FLAO|nr:hypothetical protein [Flavobacterium oreochromis]OWP75169.1 hypothetical protein BWK62_12575 [Flavobacterium oreochromis]
MKRITLILLFICGGIFAQEQTTGKIKVYTPTSSVAKKVADTYKWVVKTDVFAYLGSEFPVIFEYRVAPKLSIEGSAGLTYSMYENFSVANIDKKLEGTKLSTNPSTGTAFRAGFKYYPSADYDALEGWGFGVQLFSKIINRETTTTDYSYSNIKTNSYNKTGVELTISKQLFSDSNIAYETIFGVGFVNLTEKYNTVSYSSTNPQLNEEVVKSTFPNIHLGLRIGFGN